MRSKDKNYIGLELSKDLFDKLKEESSKKELSLSAFIRIVLIDHLERNGKKST